MVGERNEYPGYSDWMMGALAQQGGTDPAPPDQVPMGSLASDQDNQASSPLRITVRPRSFQDYLDDSPSGQQPADQLIPPPRFGFDDPANPVNQGIGQKAHELLDLGATPRDLLRGDPRYQVTPEVPGQWSERDQYRQDQLDDERATRAATLGFHMTGYGAAGSPLREYGLGAGGGRMITPPPRGRPNLSEMFAPKPPAAIGIPGVDEAAANISPAMRGLQERGTMLGAPMQSTEEAAGGALKGISDIFKQDLGQAIQRDAMVRGRSGRPIQTAPMNVSPEANQAILEKGADLAGNPPLYHVAGPEYQAGDPLRSLYSRKGNEAYDIFAQRWPDAGELGVYHPHNTFFYKTPAEAANHAENFGGTVLRVDPRHVEGLRFDSNEAPGYFVTSHDVPPEALSPHVQPPFMQAAARKGPAMGDVAAQPALAPPGIKAYHGSPYDFDRFDMSKIGTGEGAQSYGHGLYFAENPATAKAYRERLSANAPYLRGDQQILHPDLYSAMEKAALATGIHPDQAGGITRQILELIEKEGNSAKVYGGYEAPKGFERAWDAALDTARDVKWNTNPGRMYEVNINAHPDQFLDWDKPLSQMSPEVQRMFGKVADVDIPAEPGWSKLTGERALRAANERSGQIARGGGERLLHEAGIPGIKYLDQGSRGAGGGTSNYVLFDDKLIDILRKYGIAGMLGGGAGGMGELARQNDYQQ